MDNEKNELFTIRINQTGRLYIRKFAKLATAIFILSAFYTTIVVYRYWDIVSNYSWFSNRALSVWIKLESILFVIVTVLNLICVYFYARFAKKLFFHLEKENEEEFNLSFSLIFKNALLLLLVLILDLVIALSGFMSAFEEKL